MTETAPLRAVCVVAFACALFVTSAGSCAAGTMSIASSMPSLSTTRTSVSQLGFFSPSSQRDLWLLDVEQRREAGLA